MATPTRIVELADIIATKTRTVSDYLQSHNLSTPSFDANAPLTGPIPESETTIIEAQYQVVACTEELNELMRGPTEALWGRFYSSLADMLEIQFVQRFGIARLVPLNGTMPYEEIAKATGLDIVDVRRVLKRAMLNHFFQEKDGKVAHTWTSRILQENKPVADIAELFTEEIWPSFAKTVEALDRFKGRRHVPEETGFSIANNTSKGMYSYLAENPARMERFARAMGGFAATEDFGLALKGFDWTKVSTVVDVGGAWGPASIELVRAFPHLKCTVQDFEDVITEGPSKVPAEFRERISFEAHDMFNPQKTASADVYFFRAVFHNWSDVRCIEILRAHIGALKPGAHILINDKVSATPDVSPPWAEKNSRTMDLTMLTLFGSRERTYKDWVDIIMEASPRFYVKFVGPPSDMIDVVWR
ncbi:O-methyltransferase-like protein [Dactylonectria macrodidyma]|uniref:O-methyltransferase-like protein n=1 Tax=Dactylonectria macrodidyma TaxID=307937 RepID=A0A9P9DQH9_9HYPO|nr:O-methyltransferase-like protein [Dactylonectria macrodidyma]